MAPQENSWEVGLEKISAAEPEHSNGHSTLKRHGPPHRNSAPEIASAENSSESSCSGKKGPFGVETLTPAGVASATSYGLVAQGTIQRNVRYPGVSQGQNGPSKLAPSLEVSA